MAPWLKLWMQTLLFRWFQFSMIMSSKFRTEFNSLGIFLDWKAYDYNSQIINERITDLLSIRLNVAVIPNPRNSKQFLHPRWYPMGRGDPSCGRGCGCEWRRLVVIRNKGVVIIKWGRSSVGRHWWTVPRRKDGYVQSNPPWPPRLRVIFIEAAIHFATPSVVFRASNFFF